MKGRQSASPRQGDLTEPHRQSLGQELRARRLRAGLSQATVAERVGVSQNYISFLEKGDIDEPGVSVVVRLGVLFELEPNEMMVLGGWWTPSAIDTQAAAGAMAERLAAALARLEPADREYVYETALLLVDGFVLRKAGPRSRRQNLLLEPVDTSAPTRELDEA